MTLMNPESTRIRVIRAYLGMTSAAFAARLGISPSTLWTWERGRSAPQGRKRDTLAALCQESGLALLPSGFPVPLVDAILFNPKENHA